MHGQLTRLFHTARYLRRQQVWGQVRRRIVVPSGRLSSATGCAPAYPGCRWSHPKDFLPPVVKGIEADQVRQGLFRFLNITRQTGFPPRWDCDGAPRLWLYNLHYFDWLWVLDFDAARRNVLDWIGEYSNGPGRAGWEPYPTSLRLMNWCGFFFGRFRDRTQNDGEFYRPLWESIHRQCTWLSRHLETQLLNNHYLENAAALVFAGSCFRGQEAGRWLSKGLRILAGQVREQILSDGVHFELSPMYHCRILHVLILLMETEVAAVRDLLAEPVRRMTQALELLCHPDGGIALFSDSALGVYHAPGELLSHIRWKWPPLSPPGDEHGCFALRDGGYYGWRGGDGTYLIADYGRIGPDHCPGHGHADIFSFELSLNGHRVIVDSGVHDYECSSERKYCRSTAAHNTVEVEGEDQAELWGVFRVARRGYPHGLRWKSRKDGFELSAWHDGYRRLPGQPVHSRTMLWSGGSGSLKIIDRIIASRSIRAVSRLHLHSDCSLAVINPTIVEVSRGDAVCRVESTVPLSIQESLYCPGFGIRQSNQCVCAVSQGARTEVQVTVCRPCG